MTSGQRVIGLAMRVYRRSPLYPRLGRSLAMVLARWQRWRPPQPVVRDINGIRFELDPTEIIDASLYYSGTFEAQAEKAIASLLGPGMVAVDIGANIGYHTFAMARLVGPSGKVIAIEPTSAAFSKLQRNAALNAFANIEYRQVGLSDSEEGTVPVAFQSSYRLDGASARLTESVRIRTLDGLVEEEALSRLDFIKLDVDGFEGKVLRGAMATLTRFHPALLFELTPSAMREGGDDAGELVASLVAAGYELRTEDGRALPAASPWWTKIPAGSSVNLLAIAVR